MSNLTAMPTLLYFIASTMTAMRRKRVPKVPKFLEPYRQRFFGEDLHVCYGCSHTNMKGLQLDFFRTDQGGLGFEWQPVAGMESFPNIVHGGVTSTLLDEVGGVVVQADADRVGLTVSSRIHYHAPVYLDRQVFGHGRVLLRYKQYVLVAADLYDAKGKIMASMTGLYFVPNMKLFKRVTKLEDDAISDNVRSYVE